MNPAKHLICPYCAATESWNPAHLANNGHYMHLRKGSMLPIETRFCLAHEISEIEDLEARLVTKTRKLRCLLEALERISGQDPQGDTCGPHAPQICENGCIGCIARAALETVNQA